MAFENLSYEKLSKREPYGSSFGEYETEFRDALFSELQFHYANNAHYKKFADRQGLDVFNAQIPLDQIPGVHVTVFKDTSINLSSVAAENIRTKINSSATSGQPSRVVLDTVTAKRQTKAMSRVMRAFLGDEKRPFLVVDADPYSNGAGAIGARLGAVLGYTRFASETSFCMDGAGTSLEVNSQKIDEFTESNADRPAVVFGFTFVLYEFLVRAAQQSGTRYQLPRGTKIIHIGGWKMLEAKKVSKSKFNAACAEVFGVEPSDVIDIYGFTEQMGLNYPDFEDGWKRSSVFSRVIIRDPFTLEPCGYGKEGVLSFISPLPHSYPGNVVITDDLGVLEPDDGDATGIYGERFKILGRAKKAEVRGCGDIMASSVVSSEPTQVQEPITQGSDDITLRFYAGDKSVFTRHDKEGFPLLSQAEFENVSKELEQQSSWLKAQKVEDLIGLIGEARKLWSDPSYELGAFRDRGLAFLVNWCSPTNLRNMLDASLDGKRGTLDGFMPTSTLQMQKHVPVGVVGHWLSGNVPVLGMLVLVQAIVSKNANLIKVAASYADVIPALLKSFERVSYKSTSGNVIEGKDLARSIVAVYFDRNNQKAAQHFSSMCDARVAWGGADAVSSVKRLNAKWSSRDIIFGPKLSCMVIGEEVYAKDRIYKRILRKAALDICVFDQTACASPHTIFVEEKVAGQAEKFAADLADALVKTSARIVKEAETEGDLTTIQAVRAKYQFIGKVWHPGTPEWTVLYDEKEGLADPTYSRVIVVRPVKQIEECLNYLHKDIQSVGLFAQGERRLSFSEKAADLGVLRLPDIGLMTHFDDPWDGMHVIANLTKTVVLGGPSH